MSFSRLYKRCRKTNSNVWVVLFRYLVFRLFHGKKILAHQNTTIKGLKNIKSTELLDLGLGFVRFGHKKDPTYLNIGGELVFRGDYSVGRGCRIDVDENAKVIIGKGGYLNSNSRIISMHSVEIGDDCAISWDCQILDDDFHSIEYEGKKERESGYVKIGNSVWIGCSTYIYSGTRISDGSVVASNSVVRGNFDEPNVLIGGNPARVLKRDIKWSL